MHKRSLLIGVGIGIIIGALLLQLYNLGSDSQKQLNQISDEINNTTSGTVTPQPNTASSNGVEDGASGDLIEPSPSSNSELENGQDTEQEAHTPSSSAAPAVEEQVGPVDPDESLEPPVVADEPAKQYILRVHPGASVNKTAKLLVSYNIIENAASFAAHLKDRETGIRAGFFLVEEGSTDEQIRKLLSGIPLSEKESKNLINVENLTLIE
ncbi:MAG TPA: hypothetical protein IAA29_05955 [Candidatus Paenibacillus intestinavium]|nr:hypothetical protein [Candidatus Paenibacillus intestinavium]